jgi:hypothetical protein
LMMRSLPPVILANGRTRRRIFISWKRNVGPRNKIGSALGMLGKRFTPRRHQQRNRFPREMPRGDRFTVAIRALGPHASRLRLVDAVNRDDDGKDSVAEGFEPGRSHRGASDSVRSLSQRPAVSISSLVRPWPVSKKRIVTSALAPRRRLTRR